MSSGVSSWAVSQLGRPVQRWLGPDGGTRITTTIVYTSKEARDAAMATGMQEGADQSFDRLDQYLARVA